MSQRSLLPFAYTSSVSEEVPLNTEPRDRAIIDENATSMYHTRTSNRVRRELPEHVSIPMLKRKMGASFNEKDDVKRRDINDLEEMEGSETTMVDEIDEYLEGNQVPKRVFKRPTKVPSTFLPSSPPIEPLDNFGSDLDMTTGTDPILPSSPSREHRDDQYWARMSQSPLKARNLSSDADFGIDRFNRFKNPSIQQFQSSEADEAALELRRNSHDRARDIIMACFEDINTTINLESMNLVDIPEEIKDFDNLVIFNSEPTTQISFQLYLTNNSITFLPPALFDFRRLNVLGLRQNKIHSIPPLVKRLKNLTDLYLGTNRLSFLPRQILEPENLHTFRAGPNPYIKIPEDAISITTSTLNPVKMIKYVTPVRYLKNKSLIPTLRTFCLNTIAKYDVSYHETKVWKKNTPHIHHSLLTKAISRGQYEETCSECDLIVVDPAAEAYEWWDILQNKDIPIKREFCSGMCARKWESSYLELSNDS